jgi:hypothetical protein
LRQDLQIAHTSNWRAAFHISWVKSGNYWGE